MKGFSFDELHIIADEMFTSHVTAEMTVEQKKKASEDLFDELLDLMIYYCILARDDLIADLGVSVTVGDDTDRMYETIMKRIDGKNLRDRVTEEVGSGTPGTFRRLVDSEAHRNYCTTADETAEKILSAMGWSGTKTWQTMLDDKVRETHSYLQSATVPITEEFYTFDGDHAPYPGGFQDVENNVNCRCFLQYSLS